VLNHQAIGGSQVEGVAERSLPEEAVRFPAGALLRHLRIHARTDPAWVVLTLFLLVPFGLYKLRDLALPYFWDELGVYGRAAVYLHDHVLGLLPANLPPDLSRGHPLLLPCAFGALFRVFGATPLVAHVCMLLVSMALIVSVFWIARAHWNSAVGLAAAGLLVAQPLFLAQSTLLLPEVPLALLALWSMHTFWRARYLQAGTFLSMAIFVKETALVLVVVLAVTLAAQGLRARPRAQAAAGFLALGVPCLLYGIFLLIQKHQNGWYLYPFHKDQVNFHWTAMRGQLLDGLAFVFVEQGRMAFAVVLALWSSFRLFGRRTSEARFAPSVAWTFVLFALAFLFFSAGNVFMKRYLLCLLPPLAILTARALLELVRDQVRVLFPATIALCLVSLAELSSSSFNCAYDMSFREAVRVQQEATRYLESTVGADKAVLANFPTVFGLEDPRYGYVPEKFARSSYVYSPDAEYIFASEIYAPFEPPAGIRTDLVKRFSSPYMNIALYRILR